MFQSYLESIGTTYASNGPFSEVENLFRKEEKSPPAETLGEPVKKRPAVGDKTSTKQ